MVHAIAARLNLPLQLIPYKNPALLTAAASEDEWDIACLGSEPQRAKVIAFTQPYVEIQATYLVKPAKGYAVRDDIRTVSDVDVSGVEVCVSRGSAYGLWLEANLNNAALRLTDEPGLDASLKLFQERDSCDVLAGLRPWLVMQSEGMPGARLLEGSFTSVLQAVGVPRCRADGGVTMWLENFVGEMKESGAVQRSIDKHGVTGKLNVSV